MTAAARHQRRLAHNMPRLRREQGLTLKEAAKAAGVQWRHWQKVEAGLTNTTLTTICRIAAGLGVDPGELLRLTRKATR